MLDDGGSSSDWNHISSASEHQPLLQTGNVHGQHYSANGNKGQDHDRDGHLGKALPGPLIPRPSLEGEQRKRMNGWKICATSVSFFVIGMNTSALGVLIPYLEPFYHLDDTTVSLIFLAPLTGYLVAASLNSTVHKKLGQRGVAVISPVCHVLHALVFSLRPPYHTILIGFAITGFGIGLVDSAWCAWASDTPRPNTTQGFLHGSFSMGATVGPFLATSMFTRANLPWYTYYYVLPDTAQAGASLIELVLLTYAFRHDDGLRYRSEHLLEGNHQQGLLKEASRHKITWICALYFLTYVGAETSIGGWVVTFMLRVRLASPYVSGLCVSGFWIGMAVGRVVLGFATECYGERRSVTVYLAIAIALAILFRIVASIAVSLVMVTLLGFFLGPLFPSGVVMVARLLPKHLHVSALAIAAAVGQIGGAFSSFAVGALTQHWGVQIFQPVIFGLLLLVLSCWLSFPRLETDVGQVCSDTGIET